MTAQFAVVRFPEGWRVMLDGQKRGLFKFQIDATEAAIRLAQKLMRTGRKVEILVQNQVGELVKMAWPEADPTVA